MRRGDPHADAHGLTDRDPDAEWLTLAGRFPDADGLADSTRLAQSEPACSCPACSGAYAGAWHSSRDGLKRWEPTGGGSCAVGCRA